MSDKPRNHVEDLRGASRLAVVATKGVTSLVEAVHRHIAGGPALLGRPLDAPVGLVTGLVYGSIRGVTHLVGAGIDAALAGLVPLLGESIPGRERDAVIAALNGVLGDYLAETQNPLAIAMGWRRGEGPPRPRILVMIHGSSMSDHGWLRHGHDHGVALAGDLDASVVYLRYNSGLHVSSNGRELAGKLDELVAGWPVPVEELVIVAHSMGGLVARSACHLERRPVGQPSQAERGAAAGRRDEGAGWSPRPRSNAPDVARSQPGDRAQLVGAPGAGRRWRELLRALVCVGTPHHGAPLERGGNWIHLALGVSGYTAPFARLARIRSAGITDLRHGLVRDEDWQGRDRFAGGADRRAPLPLPEGVASFALAGTLGGDDGSDGLVPVASALGRHVRPELTLAFPPERQWIAAGVGHLDLLDRAEVYQRIRGWLTDV